MSRKTNKKPKVLLLAAAAGVSICGMANASSFNLAYTDGGSWNTNYAQGFSPSVEPNPTPSSGAADTVYLNRFQFYKSGTADSASNIQLVVLNNMFADLTNLTTSSASVVGVSSNTVAGTASLNTGQPITFNFNDLALTYGNNYAAMFANIGGGGQITPVLVSSLTTNYVDQGGGNFHPATNYGGEGGSYWNYSVSNFYHTDTFGTYFDVYSYGGDADFAATLTTTPAPKWNSASSGTWNTASNWANAVPNESGAPAVFGSAATSGVVTVTTDVNVVAGTMIFDNSSASYVVAGSNAITLDVPSGWTYLGSNSGSHTIAAPLSFAKNTEISVAAGSTLTANNTQASAVQLLKTGGGTYQANFVRTSSLSVGGGVVKVIPNGTAAGVSHVGNLTVAAGAKLDLGDNKLIATVTPAGTWNGSAYTGIAGMVATGRNGNTWSGSGIVTSQAAAQGSNFTSIGVATASDVRPATATATALWAGQTITGTDTLVMYTYGGDATLDGKINVDDYIKIDSGIAAGLTGWSNGDFNYDGKVNIDDYTQFIDSNIGTQGPAFLASSGGPASVSAVPEPASISGLAVALALRFQRRRSRRLSQS